MRYNDRLQKEAKNSMFFPLCKKTIDIYYANCRVHQRVHDMMLSLLTTQELEVYYKYKIGYRRREYLVGRYLLKTLFGYYLNTKPKDIAVLIDDYGKPYVPEQDIEFNLSHSLEMVVCAVNVGRKIGVDIEKITNNIFELVERFFSPNEAYYIFMQDDKDKNYEAYRLWTMKEAYLKALGKGLFLPLNSFDLFAETDMFFYSLKPKMDYILSVAVENKTKEILNIRVKELQFDNENVIGF